MPDPQYNTSVETMTPGSAVADGLQQILAQRRADAQQALLNKMNQDKFGLEQQNIQSEIASRADTNATNKTIRDAQAAATNQTVLDKQAKQARFKASSDWLRNNYIGTDDYNKLPAEAKAVWNLALTDPDTMEKLVASKMTPQAKEEDQTPLYKISRLTGKLELAGTDPTGKPIMGKKGERPVEWGVEPPQPNAANTPQIFHNTEDDPAHPGTQIDYTYSMTPSQVQTEGFVPKYRVKNAGRVIKGNKTSPKPPLSIPTAEENKISVARSAAEDKHPTLSQIPYVGNFMFGPDPQKVQEWKSASRGAIARLNLPAEVEDAAVQAINDDSVKNQPSTAIAAAQTYLSPENQKLLQDVLMRVRQK